MPSCFCIKPSHPNPAEAYEEEEVTKHDYTRETSMVSAMSCMETESSTTYVPGDPERVAQIEARLRLTQLKSLIADNTFSGGHSYKNVKIWYKQPRNEPIVSRGHVVFPEAHSLEIIIEALTEIDRIKQWDTDTVEQKYINEIPIPHIRDSFINERLYQTYCAFKGRMGFPGRDFVWNSLVAWESEDLVYLVHYSDPLFPLPASFQSYPGYIRGTTWLTGYRLERTVSGVTIDFISQVDIGNSLVPDWIITPIMKKVPERLAVLREYIHLAHRNLATS
jgi:hypothetical protein